MSFSFNKDTVRTVIFEADTPAGKAFDVCLIISILISVIAVMLDTIDTVHERYGAWLYAIEWLFTIGFTIEYFLRLWCIQNTGAYARSFYGIIDLAGILPTYLSLWVPGTQYLLVIRVLRVLRVFRILRMVRYVGEAELLIQAMRASRRKITVFVFTVLTLVVIFGSLMYLIEGHRNPSVRQHSRQHVLGGDYDDDRGLRRHHAGDAARQDPRDADHGDGLRHHRGADRYRHAGAQRSHPPPGQYAHLPGVLRGGSLGRGDLLPALRRAPFSRSGELEPRRGGAPRTLASACYTSSMTRREQLALGTVAA